MKYISYETKKNIAWIELNHPEKRNALSYELMSEMKKLIDDISKNKEIKTLIIRGKGPSFCVGHDIDELVGNYDLDHFRKIFYDCTDLMNKLNQLPQIVIAQVQGAAFAAGCQLVASCDLAVGEENATFCTPGVKIGLFCSTPMVPLSRIVGKRNALDMLLTGRVVSAKEAKEMGLINKVVKKDKLESETENLAKDISKYSAHTLSLGKKAFYHQIDLDTISAYDYTKEIISKNCLSHDAQEGMKAFLEKRKPQWKDK